VFFEKDDFFYKKNKIKQDKSLSFLLTF